ncbi:MAG: class II aldolase/adducin family protein [Polyangiaceae bacterium]
MQSRYDDIEALRVRGELTQKSAFGRPVSPTLADRTYTARLIGAESALVLHGGGNTSAKGTEVDAFGETVEVLYIKGSGSDLATVAPEGHPAVRLAALRKLRALAKLSDEQMVSELRLALLDASAPNPSIETLLHAFLPAAFIDHTHADAVLSLVDQPNGEALCRQIYGDGMVWVPYVKPGFDLAKRCIEAFEAVAAKGHVPNVILLERHGVFTFGATAKASYGAMIDAVTRAERAIADARRTAAITEPKKAKVPLHELLPRVRGVLARLAGEPSASAVRPSRCAVPTRCSRSWSGVTSRTSWPSAARRPITSSAPSLGRSSSTSPTTAISTRSPRASPSSRKATPSVTTPTSTRWRKRPASR